MLFPAMFPLAAMGGLWVWSWWRNRGVVPQVDLASTASRRAVASGGLSGELT
jgi:hypothetical protein